MVNISDELKLLYKNDKFPISQRIAAKELNLSFASLGLNIGTDQFATDKGDFELTESICNEDQIKFGKCNTSVVKFTLADVTQDIKNKEFNITQTVFDEDNLPHNIPLGYFTVDSAIKQDDLRFKDIIAYDRMKKVDVDVADWYNSLTLPMTLAAFRTSFLTYVGLTEDTNNLPMSNDTMTVERTIEPSSISGREVIEAIEEINGCFGHINRSGKFTHIILGGRYDIYPSETLYPSDNLYPGYKTDPLGTANFRTVEFEEYISKPIEKLQIRQEADDIGAIVGNGSNTYVIEGNFLVYGKSPAELEIIATNAFGNIAYREYRPYECESIGLPYLEVGDIVVFNTTDNTVGSYVFNRVLTGIQVLRDEFKAAGTEELVQNFSVNREIKQLKGKYALIKKDVEGVSVQVGDLEENTQAQFDITAEQLLLKVDTNGVISAINLTSEEAKVQANKITLEGIVTANSYFKVLLDGSIEAVNGKFSGTLYSPTMNGGDIIGSNITSTLWGGGTDYSTYDEINITGGVMRCQRTVYTSSGQTKTYSTTLTYGSLDINRIYAISIGSSSRHVTEGYYTSLDADYADIDDIRTGGRKLNKIYKDTSTTPNNLYVTLDSSQNFRPSEASGTIFNLGSDSYPWTTLHVKAISHKSGGDWGMFGATPTSKRSISTLSTGATLSEVITKVNAMISANQAYGIN